MRRPWRAARPERSRGRGDESAGQEPRIGAVVAIPACNEIDSIGGCLRALALQSGVDASRLGVVVFVNRSSDGTLQAVRSAARNLGLPLRAFEDRQSRPVNAGWARRMAMDAAAAWLLETAPADSDAPPPVILTTDADTRVPRDWVTRNLLAIAGGADVVAGGFEIDPADAGRLPVMLRVRLALERRYERLITELAWRRRPDRLDPWPRHAATSGASLAVTLAAYRAVGGMPAIAVGEDRAFVEAIVAAGGRVRHAPDINVLTSGRLIGRAAGGLSDGLRLRARAWNAPCDERLTPAAHVFFGTWSRPSRSLRPVELPLQMALAMLGLLIVRMMGLSARAKEPDRRLGEALG